MKENKIMIFLLSFTLIPLIICEDYNTLTSLENHHPNLPCGKSNPKKDTDCIKYGTDSGFCCCFIIDVNDQSKKKCRLLSLTLAESIDILKDGKPKVFIDDGEIWECGNYSSYINIHIFLLTLLSFIIFFN